MYTASGPVAEIILAASVNALGAMRRAGGSPAWVLLDTMPFTRATAASHRSTVMSATPTTSTSARPCSLTRWAVAIPPVPMNPIRTAIAPRPFPSRDHPDHTAPIRSAWRGKDRWAGEGGQHEVATRACLPERRFGEIHAYRGYWAGQIRKRSGRDAHGFGPRRARRGGVEARFRGADLVTKA